MDDELLKKVEKAAQVIIDGGVVAFPTETYYGLAVDPFNEAGLEKIYKLKKRHHAKPLLTLIATIHDLDLLVDFIPDQFLPFMDLWPAPLTLVYPARVNLPLQLTGGTSTIGVRISSHPVATALTKACGFPITATSANISGQPPCHLPQLVEKQFGSKLDFILDGGQSPGGAGSTLIGLENNKPVVLREGVLTLDSITKRL